MIACPLRPVLTLTRACSFRHKRISSVTCNALVATRLQPLFGLTRRPFSEQSNDRTSLPKPFGFHVVRQTDESKGWRFRHTFYKVLFGGFVLAGAFIFTHQDEVLLTGRQRFVALTSDQERLLGEFAYALTLSEYQGNGSESCDSTSQAEESASDKAKQNESKVLPKEHPYTQLVLKISNRIAQVSPVKMDWEVSVIDTGVVNACCFPGGKILVHAGLIDHLLWALCGEKELGIATQLEDPDNKETRYVANYNNWRREPVNDVPISHEPEGAGEIKMLQLPPARHRHYGKLKDAILASGVLEPYLAVVLSHEIGHAIARHTAEQLSWTGLLFPIAFVYSHSTSNSLLKSMWSMFTELPRSRNHEREADAIGMLLLACSCYDTRSCSEFWENGKLYLRSNEYDDYLGTHPFAKSRAQYLRTWSPASEYIRNHFCDRQICGQPTVNENLYSMQAAFNTIKDVFAATQE